MLTKISNLELHLERKPAGVLECRSDVLVGRPKLHLEPRLAWDFLIRTDVATVLLALKLGAAVPVELSVRKSLAQVGDYTTMPSLFRR